MTSQTCDLTKDEADDIIAAFDLFDKNGDGVISGNEVGPILRILGQNPTEEEINKFVSSATQSGEDYITRKEFRTVIQSYIKDQNEVEQDLREAFKKFDGRRRGSIDVVQLKKVLCMVGDPLSSDETNEFLSLADKNKDGIIKIDEFVSTLCDKI